MTSNISRVGDFGIEGDADDLQLVLLSNAGDELARYRLTPEIVYKLVTEIPKYANQLANGGVVDDSNSSNGQRQNWVSGRFAVPTKILHPRK